MFSNILFGRYIVLLAITLNELLREFVLCEIQEPINSGGIKTDLGNCNIKKGPGGSQKKYCYIQNTHPEVSKYFETEQAKTGQNCKQFRLSDFNENSPSIMYGESEGRLGNQLLGYAMLYQLRYVITVAYP